MAVSNTDHLVDTVLKDAMSSPIIEKLPVSVLLAVRNEAKNLPKCLEALSPAQEIVVVDSGSSDDTCQIAVDAGCHVLQFKHQGGYPKKRQWALENHSFSSPWILLLDADEVVPTALWKEIEQTIQTNPTENGFLITKSFHFLGKKLRFGGFSHSAVLFVRNGHARFEQLVSMPDDTLDMEVHERVIVDGSIGRFDNPVIHSDFKGLHAYIDKHNRYSSWEAYLRCQALHRGSYGDDCVRPRLLGNSQERRRFLKQIAMRMPFEHWLWFVYHFLLKLGFLDGKRGLIAARTRAHYIADVNAKVWELEMGDKLNTF